MPPVCRQCHAPLSGSQKKFCSLSCGNLARSIYPRSKTCGFCGSEFFYRRGESSKTYCNSSCAIKAHPPKSKPPFRPCLHCGKGCSPEQTQNLCSPDCKSKHRIQEWLGGRLSGSTKYGTCEFVREYMLERAGHKCSQCGFSGVNEKTKQTVLHLDHKDGNYLSNVIENLRILCPNCHAMTPNYGSLNSEGRGRRWKKQYFAFKKPEV